MDRVRRIARTVLYEGYLLWPYRRSALKNQHRFTIGGIYPPAYAERSGDRAQASFASLIEGDEIRVCLELRFLHLVHRQAYSNEEPVDAVEAGERRHLTWDEAVERTIATPAVTLARPVEIPFDLPAGSAEEPLDDGAAFVRNWDRIRGRVLLAAEHLRPGVRRLRVTIANDADDTGSSRDAALRQTLAAAHVLLRADAGAFVSAIDPPEHLRDEAEQVRSEGLWPVLAGAEGDRSTILAAPVILYDYPDVADESPGDHFDGGEVDELLVHSILALTDEEKREMADTDPRAREILDRTAALSGPELARLHGRFRDVRSGAR